MTNSTVTFYPVGNGGMTFINIKLNDDSNTTICVDINIRSAADDPNDDTYDVASHLRSHLKKDKAERPYIDVFVLTHNDVDHISGIQKHFHLGSLEDYKEPGEDEEPKIVIQEMWSSCRFWKRDSKSNNLCDDAKAFNREMKRRVKLYEENQEIQKAGDRAIILGEDEDGKTEGLTSIVRKIGTSFSKINEKNLSGLVSIKLLGPLPQQDDEDDENFNKKNRGSVIMQLKIVKGTEENILLLPGDAEVDVWEYMWTKYPIEDLKYDILWAPHHCSWHSLSHDSYSQSENPKVSKSAKLALSKAKAGAFIVSSSKPIKSEGDDPPSEAAKDVYLEILDNEEHFRCTEEYPKVDEVEPMVFKLTSYGPQLLSPKSKAKHIAGASAISGESYSHG
jgi:hypothetical protein